MMRRLITLSLIILTGCTSTMQTMDGAPNDTLFSDKPPQVVAFCIANKNETHVSEGPNGERIVMIKNDFGGLSMMFSVFPNNDGSRIEFRKNFGMIGVAWKQCL